MPDNVLVFYGSYRTARVGMRMATFVTNELRARGALPELIDARELGLPILDRMYKEYPAGSAPQAMEVLAQKIRAADAFVFVVGEYMGAAAWPEEPHRSLFGGVVLATRSHCQLLAGPAVRRPGRIGLASHPL